MHGVAVINITSLTPSTIPGIHHTSRILGRLTSLVVSVGQREPRLASIAINKGGDDPVVERVEALRSVVASPETVLDGDWDLSRGNALLGEAGLAVEKGVAVEAALAVRLVELVEVLLSAVLDGPWDAFLRVAAEGVAWLALAAAEVLDLRDADVEGAFV